MKVRRLLKKKEPPGIQVNNSIEFNEVSCQIEAQTILENFSFKVPEGASVVLSGPSGAGKSTVLKLILGFQVPSAGSIRVASLELNRDSIQEIRSRVAYIPQSLNLDLPVEDFFRLAAGFSKERGEFKIESIKNMLNTVLLREEILQKNFNSLSGGEKQRVLTANALLLNRSYILADEPTSALDDKLKKIIISLIMKSRATRLIVSHDQALIASADAKVFVNGR